MTITELYELLERARSDLTFALLYSDGRITIFRTISHNRNIVDKTLCISTYSPYTIFYEELKMGDVYGVGDDNSDENGDGQATKRIIDKFFNNQCTPI